MPPNPGGNTSKRRPSRPLRVPATISFGKDSWSISDTYSYGGSTVNVSAIAVDAAGKLFVGGQVSDSAGKLWWLVRKGVPGTKRVRQGNK